MRNDASHPPRQVPWGVPSHQGCTRDVLCGLTAEESEFLTGWYGDGLIGRSNDEILRFYELWIKHEEARLRNAVADEPVVKDESRLG